MHALAGGLWVSGYIHGCRKMIATGGGGGGGGGGGAFIYTCDVDGKQKALDKISPSFICTFKFIKYSAFSLCIRKTA